MRIHFLILGTLAALWLAACSTVAPRPDVKGLVEIGGNRKIFLECQGTGSPTVVLISGTGGAGDEWMSVFDAAGKLKLDDTAVFPTVSKFTRVCVYDRPGTERSDGTLSPSTAVTQPTTAQANVADLHALLSAADEGGPFVLVGASWGGLIAQLYARTYPDQVTGLVLVDAASEFLKETLTPAQWTDWMQKIKNPAANVQAELPDYEPSITAMRAASPARAMPVVVISSDKAWDLQIGNTGSTWDAWLAAQARLAALLSAKHISNTNSDHGIAVEQPQLVVGAIREVIDAVRVAKTN